MNDMETKKIYKWARGMDALELLEKEGGVNVCKWGCSSSGMYYIPYNGGIIHYNAGVYSDITGFVKANGIEIKKQEILDDVERKYLSNVCRPFMKGIDCILKKTDCGNFEFIEIIMKDGDFILFPNFIKGTMYKGIKLNKKYTPKELNLK